MYQSPEESEKTDMHIKGRLQHEQKPKQSKLKGLAKDFENNQSALQEADTWQASFDQASV